MSFNTRISPISILSVITFDSAPKEFEIPAPVTVKKFNKSETVIRAIFASETHEEAIENAESIDFASLSRSLTKECKCIIANTDLTYDDQKYKSRFRIISQRLLDLVSTSIASSDNLGDNHVKLFDTIQKTQVWAKAFFNGIREIDPSFSIYNISHICNGDRKGGHHLLIDPTRIIEQLAINPENGVSVCSIKEKTPGNEGKSTFYPAEINSTTLLLNLLSRSIEVGLGVKSNAMFKGKVLRFVQTETTEGETKGIYLISVPNRYSFIVGSCYPCLKVFEYDGNSPKTLDFNGKTLELEEEVDLVTKAPLAFISENFNYYQIRQKYFGFTGIFIKVPNR
jgi:hypothetical protein